MTGSEAFEEVPFLRAIPAEKRRRLLPRAALRTFSRTQGLWCDGQMTNDFSFLARGRVKLVKCNADGKETILDLCLPGQLLCASAVCAVAPYCCRAVAAEDDTTVLSLPRQDLLELVERNPPMTHGFMKEITCRTATLCRRVNELAGGQVERRVSKLLLRLADEVGQARDGEGTWIPVALSRQDLADMCGTTIETAIRIMSRLQREGIVQTVTSGFVVANRPALEDRSAGRGSTGVD